YFLPSRMWEFCFGMFLAMTNRRPSDTAAALFSIFGVCLAFSAFFLLPAGSMISPLWRLIPAFGAAFIILGGMTPNAFSDKVLGHPAISILGRLSFSAYLIHWPLWTFLNSKYHFPTQSAIRVLLIPLVFAGAYLLYRCVERPAQSFLRAQPMR